MVRLADVETSLDAVEKAVGTGTRQRSARVGEAKKAEKGNEIMDRKGGGPIKWSEFYGRTAEKFFYHPVDRNTTYHTTTVLSQQSPQADNKSGEGVPSRQGLPVHQRPPQFDYIYKANRDAKARAERDAAELRNKVDALQARRRQLEDEQAALWCQIAFRVVSRYDLPKKPLYRFEPIPVAPDTESRQHAEAVKAAAIFMRRAVSIVEEAESSQSKAFGSVKAVVSKACDDFDDAWLRLSVLPDDAPDLKTPAGRFTALSKLLKDVSENLSDSYEVSIDGDRFKDEQRKDTFRALLQESLVDYAEVVLALNEMSLLMASEWKTKPDTNKPLVVASISFVQKKAEVVDDGSHARNPRNTNPSRPAIPNETQGLWSKPVSLKPPYKGQTGTPSGKLTLQYAVLAILGQVGLKYDFDASIRNANQECRTYVTPNFQDKPCGAALEELLAPFPLKYEVNGDTVTLKRK